MLKWFKGSGQKRLLTGSTLIFRDILSAVSGLYLVFAVLFYPEPILHKSIAFGLFYSIIFLSYSTPGIKETSKIPIYDYVLSGASLSVSVYIGLNINRLVERLVFVDPVFTADIIFGAITIFLLFEGTRRVLGPWLPGLSLLALIYMIFGHHIPGRFGHLKYGTDNIIDGFFLSGYGIWGSTMGIATGKIMIFLLFGSLFRFTGAGDFLFDFVSKIAGKTKGGIAKVAIITSAMFGMVSGGPLTNVTTTGAMTIPAMKKSGFSSEYAACIESCASVGGIFMPPIMGSVAFIMSDVVGIQYFEVIKRAAIPALIYFAALFFAVDFKARKDNVGSILVKSKESLKSLFLRGYTFFIPLIYLIVRLMMGRTASYAGIETIVIMLILGFANKKKRLTIKSIYLALKDAISKGVLIVSTMAMCGILIGTIDLTGLAAKLNSYLFKVADFSMAVALIMVMVITIFLGLAMNISSSYLIAAVLGGPILVSAGFEPLSVHMFILFFAAMATITPPVAITSYAAASIAGAKPMKVGFMSMKVGLVAYILPFAFILKPEILLYGTFAGTLFSVLSALIGTGILAMGLEGWLFNLKIDIMIRYGLIISGIVIVLGNWQFILFGLTMMILLYMYAFIKNGIKIRGKNEKI